MIKTFKVWVEVEEYDPATDAYTKSGEPLDLHVEDEKEAFKLQTTLHSIGEDILAHFGKEQDDQTDQTLPPIN